MLYFIYETTNLINNKKYRGYHTTENLNDGYLGSGTLILKAIKKYGESNFHREILEFCNSLDEVIEREGFYVNEDWVRDEATYNLILGGRYIRQTAESRERLSIIMREKYEKGEHRVFGYKKGDKRIPWNKGLTGVQEPWNKGLAGAQEAWNKGLTGAQEPWNKGLTGSSLREEHKESISNGMKELYRNGYVNHTKGKKYPDRKTTNGMEPWNKGFSAPKYICDYCQREVGGLSNLKRWHNDNCKHKP